MSTDSHGSGDQPTTPIPRSGRTDDPTQIFETFGSSSAQGAPRTEALPTGQPTTRALPVDPPPTEALPTDAPRTRALLVDPSRAQEPAPERVSAFGADAGEAVAPAGTATTTQSPTGSTAAQSPAGTTSTPGTTGTTSTTAATTERPVSRTLRVGTVVWGLIIAIIGAGLISVAGGARFDVELVLIGLLALAGVALVVGSLVASMRRRH